MKLSKPESPPALSEDDWVTCGVTHNIKINGDDAWPKFEAGSRVRPGETPDEAYKRLSEYVNNKAIAMSEDAAQAVIAKGDEAQ